MLLLVHVVAGRAVNRSLAWVTGARLANGNSVVANFDDHSFLLSLDSRIAGRCRDSARDLQSQRIGKRICGVRSPQLKLWALPSAILQKLDNCFRDAPWRQHSARAATWNGSLLYKTLLEHEPDHPLFREAVREVLEDQCDAQRARAEARGFMKPRWRSMTSPAPRRLLCLYLLPSIVRCWSLPTRSALLTI